jgi:hypothetical protein
MAPATDLQVLIGKPPKPGCTMIRKQPCDDMAIEIDRPRQPAHVQARAGLGGSPGTGLSSGTWRGLSFGADGPEGAVG